MTAESRKIAEDMIASEQFMWLMVGANHPESHLADLRKVYFGAWKEAGGISWGKSGFSPRVCAWCTHTIEAGAPIGHGPGGEDMHVECADSAHK